ncbi:6644_t:CDS:2 [Diversispora eburnea]|uniref:6644_t:CDS:1 n=1 Tax=Diversispora eburnea TaxID=1213867 RepID=A0A9N8VEU6_9GLOM|nr:6644_t:CDS:2 [Diversispora eburnea]
MPTYTPSQIFYLSLHFTSIFLILVLNIHLFRSKPFITKWTLIQICLSLLGYSLFAISSLVIFGDRIQSEDSEELCSILAKLTTFFHYPVITFTSVLSCYLWFLIVKTNLNLEKVTLRWISAMIWGWSLVYLLFIIIMARDERMVKTTMYCKLQVKWYNYYVYWTVMSILILFNFGFGGHSIYILYKRWSIFKNKKNRQTAINLGYSVRVAAYISLYTFLMLSYLVSDTISISKSKETNDLLDKEVHIGDFTSALRQPESLELKRQETQSTNDTNVENTTETMTSVIILDLSQDFINHYNEI